MIRKWTFTQVQVLFVFLRKTFSLPGRPSYNLQLKQLPSGTECSRNATLHVHIIGKYAAALTLVFSLRPGKTFWPKHIIPEWQGGMSGWKKFLFFSPIAETLNSLQIHCGPASSWRRTRTRYSVNFRNIKRVRDDVSRETHSAPRKHASICGAKTPQMWIIK